MKGEEFIHQPLSPLLSFILHLKSPRLSTGFHIWNFTGKPLSRKWVTCGDAGVKWHPSVILTRGWSEPTQTWSLLLWPTRGGCGQQPQQQLRLRRICRFCMFTPRSTGMRQSQCDRVGRSIYAIKGYTRMIFTTQGETSVMVRPLRFVQSPKLFHIS